MENHIAYAFDTAQEADRFLNRLKGHAKMDVRVKRYKGDKSILVTYNLPSNGVFDITCQQLDVLAESMNGQELSI